VQGFYFGKPVPAAEISADILKNFRKTLAGEPVETKLRVVKGAAKG
jgi:hypothetical protein